MFVSIFIINFFILGIMDETEQNIFHSSVCYGPEFTLVIKVMDLTVSVFLFNFLVWDPKI